MFYSRKCLRETVRNLNILKSLARIVNTKRHRNNVGSAKKYKKSHKTKMNLEIFHIRTSHAYALKQHRNFGRIIWYNNLPKCVMNWTESSSYIIYFYETMKNIAISGYYRDIFRSEIPRNLYFASYWCQIYAIEQWDGSG